MLRSIIFLSIALCCGRAVSQTVSDKCVASYYADKFNGRKCSSGEKFSQDKLTAAHKTLKFGTMVKVTNLKNDSSVIVRINDRLPANSKRCIDLTKAGARQLNYLRKGLTRVKIEIVKDSLP
jgi:rare lipoprotein A